MTPTLRCLGIIALVAALVSLPNLVFGVSYGDSHLYNVSWLHGFTTQLWAGEWYPRWLMELNGGSGSLAFFIYAPLPFYVSAIFGSVLCPGCDTTIHLAIGEALLLVASGAAFYAFARQYGRPWVAMVGALFYMLAPYHFEIDLWNRQAVGEFAAYVWMPLVLICFQKALDDWRFVAACALCYAALILSHLPAALLFSLFLPIFALLHAVWRRSVRPFVVLAASVVLGIGLSSVYLLPALFVQQFDAYAATAHYFHYYDNWFFFDHRHWPDPAIATRIFHVLLGMAAAGLFASVVIFRARGEAVRAAIPWILALALVLFMVSPLSTPLWKWVPVLQQVQFPWRIMILADLGLATLFVVALDAALRQSDRISWTLFGASAAVAAVLGLSGWSAFVNFEPFYLRYFPAMVAQAHAELAAGADTPEYRPATAKLNPDEFEKIIAAIPPVNASAGAGDVQVTRWRPRDIQLRVNLRRASELTVKQFYWNAWRAVNSATGSELALSPAEPTGLIVVHAPAGRYDVALRLAPLRQERLGLSLTALSLVALAGVALYRKRSAPAAENPASARIVT